MYTIPLAYKYVTIIAMITQVNYYGARMQLPIHTPLNDDDLKGVRVDIPVTKVPNMSICGGYIQAGNYSFIFGDKSHDIANLDKYGYQSFGIPMGPTESTKSGMERAARMKFIVSTNDVYRMATNWLIAMDVDLDQVEKIKPPHVNNYPFFNSDRGSVPNPLITVVWKGQSEKGSGPSDLEVQVSAITGELLKLSDGQGAFSKRSQPLVVGLKELVAIPDDAFLRYSTLERSNLLVKYAGVHCSDLHCPGIQDVLCRETNTVTESSQY
jgi:hypothetical protein